MMKFFLAAAAILATISAANANVTCTRFGNTLRCHDWSTGQSTTCTVFGNTTNCY